MGCRDGPSDGLSSRTLTIDCAADASVVNAVNDGIGAAMSIASVRRPWVMISVNDHRRMFIFVKLSLIPRTAHLIAQGHVKKFVLLTLYHWRGYQLEMNLQAVIMVNARVE